MSRSIIYPDLMRNLSRHSPATIPPILFGAGGSAGSMIEFADDGVPMSGQLWQRKEEDITFIGVRVNAPITDKYRLAADLCAVAVERQIIPIFLSRIGDCGMQHFGFRVEFVEASDAEGKRPLYGQLQRLWDFAIEIDAEDLGRFL